MSVAYMCGCGQRIKKLYEVCSATWMQDLLDVNDDGGIYDWGDSEYTWECSDTHCHIGATWQDMPAEWPRCNTSKEGCTIHAVVVNDETENGYCEPCVNSLADNGHEEAIYMRKMLQQEASQ